MSLENAAQKVVAQIKKEYPDKTKRLEGVEGSEQRLVSQARSAGEQGGAETPSEENIGVSPVKARSISPKSRIVLIARLIVGAPVVIILALVIGMVTAWEEVMRTGREIAETFATLPWLPKSATKPESEPERSDGERRRNKEITHPC